MKGKIIVFEGIDGSGKGTQSKKLYRYLKSTDEKVALFEFPSYDETFFGKEVASYLNGNFGSLNDVHPKLSAMLYAGDRYEKRNQIVEKLDQGYIVICDRYIPSNIAHQISKFKDDKDKYELKRWIEKLEYEVYKMPKPNTIFFMNMDPEFSNKLVLNKKKRNYTDKKQDLHEINSSYLCNVYKTFKKLAEEENWVKITCQTTNNLKSAEDIHLVIVKLFQKIYE